MRALFAIALLTLGACDKAAEPQAAATQSAAPPIQATSAQLAPAAEPTERADVDLPPRLRAIGTEPFWSAEITPDQVTYSTPEDQDGETFKVRRDPTPEGSVLIGRLDDANFVLAIARHECSDGMSDRVYRWRAVLRRDGKSLRGCAETPDRLGAATAD